MYYLTSSETATRDNDKKKKEPAAVPPHPFPSPSSWASLHPSLPPNVKCKFWIFPVTDEALQPEDLTGTKLHCKKLYPPCLHMYFMESDVLEIYPPSWLPDTCIHLGLPTKIWTFNTRYAATDFSTSFKYCRCIVMYIFWDNRGWKSEVKWVKQHAALMKHDLPQKKWEHVRRFSFHVERPAEIEQRDDLDSSNYLTWSILNTENILLLATVLIFPF